MMEFGADLYVGRLFFQLIRRLPEPERLSVLRDIVESGGIGAVVSQLAVLAQQHGRNGASQPSPRGDWIVSEEVLAALKSQAAERIGTLAAGPSLLANRRLPGIIHYWGEWTGVNEGQAWVASVTERDEDLVRFLEHYLSETKSKGMGDRTVRRTPRMRLDDLRQLIELDMLAERIKALDAGPYSDRQRLAVAQLLKEFEAEKSGLSGDEL